MSHVSEQMQGWTRREPFVIEHNGQNLFGMVHRMRDTTGEKHAGVAIFHGFLGSKDQPHRIFVRLSEALAEAGLVAVRIDLRGRGDSDGESIDITPQADLDDARLTVEYLRAQPDVDPDRIALVGLSWGGILVALLAGEDASVRAGVLWSSVPTETLDWQPEFTQVDGRDVAENWGNLVGREFYEGLREIRPLDAARKAQGKFLVIYGTDDESVPQKDVDAFATAVAADVVAIDGADHVFMRHAWEAEVISRTVAWLKANV